MYVQQYMALAAIYLTRSPKFNFNPTVLGIPMYDASTITQTLRSLLEQSESVSRRASRRKNTNARLWTLYVGALSEQINTTNRCDPDMNRF